MKTPAILLAALVLCVGTASAAPITYRATLTGAAEAPPNNSNGTGLGTLIFDLTAHTMYVEITFQDLTGTTTASHAHCCTVIPGVGNASVATAVPSFPFFPLGVTSGSMTNTFDTSLASTWNPAFITANGGIPNAEAFFAAGLANGTIYLNVHTTFRPGGEIRGFFSEATSPIPEPTTLTLLGLGLVGLAARARRSRA